MKYLSNTHLVGTIQGNIDLRKTKTGKDVASFTVKTVFTTDKGSDIPTFHKVVAWEDKGVYINQEFKAGDWIDIEGIYTNRSYDAKDGARRFVAEMNVSAVNDIKVEDKQDNKLDEMLDF